MQPSPDGFLFRRRARVPVRFRLPGRAILLLALAAGVPESARASCQMQKLGTFPVTMHGNSILIPGRLNDTDITILVDTGAMDSVIWMDAVKRAGLYAAEDQRYRALGVSGQTSMYHVKVDKLTIGDYAVRDRLWPVIGGAPIDENLGMILGADFWSKVDFEINLPKREIVLWEARDCRKAPLAYWDPHFMLAVLQEAGRGLIQTDVSISGTKVRAMLDTGAETTSIDSKFARRVGFHADQPGTAGDHQEVFGIGDQGTLRSVVGVFDQFEMGDLSVKNARIRIMDMEQHLREGSRLRNPLMSFNDVIVGADFLVANRVLVANSQGFLYMTYTGGRIFQTEAPQDESAESAPGQADAAADIEDALNRGRLVTKDDFPKDAALPLEAAMHASAVGDLAEAERGFREILAAVDRAGGGGQAEAVALTSLGSVLYRQKKYSDAEPVYLRLQPVAEKVYGAIDPGTASAAGLLGQTYLAEHKYAEAESSFSRALGIAEKASGPEARQTGAIVSSLGTALEGLRKYAEAESAYVRAETIVEKNSGPDHENTGMALIDVARMSETLGNDAEARSLYQRARDIFARKFGEDNSYTRYADEGLKRVHGDAPP